MGKQEKTIVIDGKDYTLNIFVERRNSVRASLTNGGINIRLPKHLSTYEQNVQGKKLLDWAVAKIKSGASREYGIKEYCHGHQLNVLGRVYTLDIEHRLSVKNFTKLKGDTIYLKIANHHSEEEKQEYISKQLRKILAQEHLEEITSHVHRINELCFGKNVGEVSIKYTTSRWGQCHTGSGDIHLSTRLLLAPLPIIEYVIVHELAHLVHANHSRRFWDRVGQADPDYKKKVKWIKANGYKLTL